VQELQDKHADKVSAELRNSLGSELRTENKFRKNSQNQRSDTSSRRGSV